MSETRHNINLRFQNRRKVWQDQHSFATTLLTLFIDTYGTEALQWDPLTIQTEIERDFDVKLSRSLFDRLMAGIAVLSTDSFFKSLPDFINLCNVISGSPFDPTVFDPADAGECAWGMTEALMISPPDDDEQEPFAQEIVDYISEVLKNEGILTPPDILRVGLKGDYAGLADKIKYDFSDDPEMFQAIFETEKAKADDINSVVKERLRLLVQQLESTPLDNGDSSEVVKKLAASLPK
jgi:hypothetical protein